jgi:hypothetical protein
MNTAVGAAGSSALRVTFAGLESAITAAAQAYYGRRLVSLVLYGSAARGTMRHDSDLDLLVIAEDLPQGRMARIREFEAVENAFRPALLAALAAGVESELSAVIKSPVEAAAGSPLFLDMVDDARILHDRAGFFAAVLERLRTRLLALGSRRIWRGNAWYWVLKPDLKPGEVFEL